MKKFLATLLTLTLAFTLCVAAAEPAAVWDPGKGEETKRPNDSKLVFEYFTDSEKTVWDIFEAEDGEMLDGARINGVKNGRQYVEKPDLSAGGVAFYEGNSTDPSVLDMAQWVNAIRNDTDPCVLPEQALCVTRILEAIYESSETGKPVFFD